MRFPLVYSLEEGSNPTEGKQTTCCDGVRAAERRAELRRKVYRDSVTRSVLHVTDTVQRTTQSAFRPSQLLMRRRIKAPKTGRGRGRERERAAAAAVACLLNLSSLHTLRPCVRSGTRAEPQSTGARELEAWPVRRGEGLHAATGRVSMLLQLKSSLPFAFFFFFFILGGNRTVSIKSSKCCT